MKHKQSLPEKRNEGHATKPALLNTEESNPLAGVGICVIGGGFVGLVAAAGFAEFGHSVVCVENNLAHLESLKKNLVPFYERDLEDLLHRNVERDRLRFTDNLEEAVKGQQAIFVTVGTPPSESGRAEMSALDAVISTLASSLKPEQIVVLKSTVPIGTGNHVYDELARQRNGNGDIQVINNPEFLREGNAVYDFFHPQRIVIGGSNQEAVSKITDIYRLGMVNPVPILTTNNATAEMIKYASNAFLATKVGFVNELAGLCDHAGVNVLEVARGMGMDPRISPDFLDPGPGWGGSCFRKDLLEFTGLADSKDFSLLIASAVLEANLRQHDFVVDKVKRMISSLKGANIGVLGLSFKANTSDMRDSPSIPIIQKLLDGGAKVKAYDPQAHIEAKKFLPGIELSKSAYEAAEDVDCLLILTEWQEFQVLDLKQIASKMKAKNLVDARNLLVPEEAERYGFNYQSMGQV